MDIDNYAIFDFEGDQNPSKTLALSVYKITPLENDAPYFYVYTIGCDGFVDHQMTYNYSTNKFYHGSPGALSGEIENGEMIIGIDQNVTSCLEEYWDDALVSIYSYYYTYPLLLFGPFNEQTIEYEIHRAVTDQAVVPSSDKYIHLTTNVAPSFDFTDYSFDRNGYGQYSFYKIIVNYNNHSFLTNYIFHSGELLWNAALYQTDKNNHPHLAWGPHPTFTATNYKIYRAICPHPVSPRLRNYQLIYTTSSSTFSYTDYETYLQDSDYYIYYYVKAYNSNNSSYSSPTNVVERYSGYNPSKWSLNSAKKDLTFRLNQNYPNPFNPSTEIRYAIPRENLVQLKVYDTFGREVSVLVIGRQESGTYTVNFDGKTLASGVYFYEIVTGEFRDVRKMLLVK